MTTTQSILKISVAAAALSLFSFAPAYASGSGGGAGGGFSGGSNSNLPQTVYNPVQDYQDGLTLLRSNEFKKADRKFAQVLKATRRNASANYYMGVAKVGQGKDKSSIRYFKNAAKYQADLYEAHAGLGEAYAKTGKTEKAQKVLTQLQSESSNCNGCADSDRIQTAITQIETALAGGVTKSSFLSPYGFDSIDTQYFAAVSLINRGEYQTAFNDLVLTQAAAGPHPDITTYMGYTQRKLGNYDLAKTYYAMALEVAPNHKGANEYLGELYVETGELDLAKTQLAKLETICSFGCIEENELRGWIIDALP